MQSQRCVTGGWEPRLMPPCTKLSTQTAKQSEAVSINSFRLIGIGIPTIKIRRSHDRIIFITEIPIPGKTVFILRRDPGPTITRYTLHHSTQKEHWAQFELTNNTTHPDLSGQLCGACRKLHESKHHIELNLFALYYLRRLRKFSF